MALKPNDPRKWPKKIAKAPIEGLKTEEQFKKISSNPRTKWITDILDLGKRTNVNIINLPAGGEDKKKGVDYVSPYASVYNRSDHIPFSDWSAKTNYEYYGKLMDLEVNWGHPIYHRPPRPFDPPKMKPGLYTPPPHVSKQTGGPWTEYEQVRRNAYEEALRFSAPLADQLKFWWGGEMTTLDVVKSGYLKILKDLKEIKENYWTWPSQKALSAFGSIRHKLDMLTVETGRNAKSYYYKCLVELNARIDAVQQAFRGYTITNDIGWWALIYIIFIISLTTCSIATYERIAQARHLQVSRFPAPIPASTRVIFNFERSDVDPISEPGPYDLLNPPTVEFPEFVYSPPPIKDLAVRPNGDLMPYQKPYDPFMSFIKGREYDIIMRSIEPKEDDYYSAYFVYPKLNLDEKGFILIPDTKEVVKRPPADLNIWEKPKKLWIDYLQPKSYPGDKPKTFFQAYGETLVALISGFFGLTILPWVAGSTPKTIEGIPDGAEIPPFVRRINDWLGTYYYKESWEKLDPQTKADLVNQMNRRIYFLDLVNEVLLSMTEQRITEEKWLELDIWERQALLNLVGDNLVLG